ncbi:hypothetical protein TNCV_4892111 [Trichonephila clavipes]|nr:hypothetical protein TNCV_4892111 [Trichonephila clavipes]
MATLYIETLVIPLDELQKSPQEKLRALYTEEVFNGLIDFSIASKAPSDEIHLQSRKQMKYESESHCHPHGNARDAPG